MDSLDKEVGEDAPLINSIEEHFERGYNYERSTGKSPATVVPSDRSKLVRTPVHFYSLDDNDKDTLTQSKDSAMASRYRYYQKLAKHKEEAKKLTMPDHIVPSVFLFRLTQSDTGSQPSWVTIFSLWNTMMGTSLLSIPWAINQAGFSLGVFFLVFLAVIMFYTSYRSMKAIDSLKVTGTIVEFHDVCRHYLGRWAEVLAFVSGLLSFLGGMIVYMILMSNFLYDIVSFIYHHAVDEGTTSLEQRGPVCPSVQNYTDHHGNPLPHDNVTNHHDNAFSHVWREQLTVPFFLLFVIVPLISIRSPTFFTRLNALGALTVSYMLIFVLIMMYKWGVNFSSTSQADISYVPEARPFFPALTGVATFGYFAHNSLPAIFRTQKNPQHNVRDLFLAYVLVLITYLLMGVVFYISFPLDKDCIEDNLLKNVAATNVLAFVGRIGLFFQLVSIFPLLVYVFRSQSMKFLFKEEWPSWKHVAVVNVGLVSVCLIFAVFLPHIGKINAFIGAYCGFTYGILLPCLVYLKLCYIADKLTWKTLTLHIILIVIGLSNFCAQFFIAF